MVGLVGGIGWMDGVRIASCISCLALFLHRRRIAL